MFRRTWLTGLVCLSFLATIPAAAPPVRPLGAADFQKLIEQLGDRSFRVRELAERQLAASGIAALPYLKKAVGHRDPEVRKRALRLVPGLELAAIVSPKRITLNIKDQPLTTIFAEISKQTGYKIQYQNSGIVVGRGGVRRVQPKVAPKGGVPAEETFSYNFRNTTFWEALDEICRDAGLIVQQGYSDEVIRLYNSSSNGTSAFTGVDGPFRYVATNMQLYRNVDLTAVSSTGVQGPARNETLTFSFNIFAEPRLPFLGMNDPRVEAAYDSERNSMIPRTTEQDMTGAVFGGFGGIRMGRRYYNGGYKQMSLNVSVQLQRVSEKAGTLKTIRGVIPVQLLVEQKPVILAEKIMSGKGKKTVAGDVEFTIEDVKKVNNQIQIKFTAVNKANNGDYSWTNTIYQRLELQDDKGNKFQNWGSNWHNGGNNSVTMTMTFNSQGAGKAGAEPTKFIFMNWVTRQHDVNFEFRDIPLP